MTASADPHADYSRIRLFILSPLALVTAGLAFRMPGATVDDLKAEFFNATFSPLRFNRSR